MSLSELTLILFVALVLFGPEDLPDIARALGKMVYKLRKLADEVSREFQEALETPSNVINESLKETPKTDGKSPEKKANDEEVEELLTYDDAENNASSASHDEKDNPLAELPSDMVLYHPEDETSR